MSHNIQALGEKVEALRAEIVELDAVEAPTEEQAARFDAAMSEFDTAKAEYDKAVERAAKVEAVRAAAVAAPEKVERAFHAPSVVVRNDPFSDLENLRSASASEKRDRALAAFEGRKVRGVSDSQLESLVEKIETVPGVAEHALLLGTDAYRSAFETYTRAQGINPLYSAEEVQALRAAHSLTSANGGFSLPTLLDPTLIHTGTASKTSLRNVSRVVQGTQNVWNGVSAGNVTTYWVAENTALTEGSPTYAGPQVTAAKLTAWITGSIEVFQDSDLLAQMPGLIAESFDYAEADAFITGSGSNAPKGIVTCLSGTAGVTVTATTRGQFNTASAVDVFAILNAIPSRYEDNATWVANKATFNTIKQMSTGSQGAYFWSDFNAAIGSPLLGSPILQSSAMATAQTSGTKLIVLGDFSQFLIYDRIGTSVEYVQTVVDGSGLPTGTRGLVAYKRVGSNVTDQNAFRIFNT
jgi:HK97 family phage major capsid protein